LRLASLADLFC